ncbi:MAG TPA: ABC transporter ATP-binding protein [Dongiaceae bacterium]|nr:ABC transporter ATP-binding protein [Dongiaceae bacterium]
MTTAPILSVDRLRVELTGLPPLVNDINLTIAPGEILALVGESGSGKTLAARAILDLLPPGIARTAGRILFDGIELTGLPEPSLRAIRGARIGMVFQEPMVSLNPALTIGDQMLEGLLLHRRIGKDAAKEKCLAMLRRIQIADPERCFSAYPHEFSGGMRQRIMLASVMLLRPALLIADEPTTALDTLVQQDVLELMVELAKENGTAVLMISHDLAMVARYAHHIAVMRQGHIVEQGEIADILFRPQHPYTRRLLDALPKRGPARQVDRTDAPLIAARDVTVDYAGRQRWFSRGPGKRAVDGVSLEIFPRETVALVGASGSGKTTLGRCLAGLIKPSGGELLYRGKPVGRSKTEAWRDYRLNCQMVFQDPFSSLDPRMRVGDIVAEPLRHVPNLGRLERLRLLERILADVGLDSSLAQRFPHELSGGQRQRVAIGRAIIRRPALIIADEPVSALDMTIQNQILELLKSLQDTYDFACLFISHDLGAVEQVADRVLVMDAGKVVETGPRDEIFDRPRHDYTKRLLAASPSLSVAGSGFELQTRSRLAI